MANTFRMTNNASVGTSLTTIYTCPADTTSVVIGIMCSNTSSASVNASIKLNSSTANSVNTGQSGSNTNCFIVKDVPIQDSTSLEIMSGNKIVLQEGDVIQLQSSGASSLDIIISYMEMT